jgi:HK97 gp10 family phage protein
MASSLFDFDVKITAKGDVIDRLSKLPDKLQKKGARKASRDAMNLVRNVARAAARGLDDSDSPQVIWRNIATQESARGGRRIGGVVMRVGVRGGAQYSESLAQKSADNPGGYTWYWRFLEHGTKRTNKQEFLLPALEDNAQKVEALLAEYLEREIEKLTPNVPTAV